MGCIKTLFILGVVEAIGVALVLVYLWNIEAEMPEITKDGYWGPGQRVPETDADQKIVPFKINVPDKVLIDLKQRLNNARFKTDLEERTFRYGFRSEYMKEIATYWKDKYDWRKHEKILNSFDQYTTKIEGLKVHFLHIKPKVTKGQTIPMMMVHGWPGSIWEFYKIIPMLTDPKNDIVFEMICPSIPGFGYSEASHKPGFDQADTARIFVKLMKRLGHDKYYVQGGDWGSNVLTLMSQIYPENILGIHTNMAVPNFSPRQMLKQIFGYLFPVTIYGSQFEADKVYPYGKNFIEQLQESGYFHLQATKPDTVGLGLNDSPIGLASWVLEKFGICVNITYRDLPDGGTTKKFTLDELLTNVMIYWTNENAASSARFYKEYFASEEVQALLPCGVYVPAGVACMPGEIMRTPRAFAEETFRNLIQYTDLERGGHFAALEEPRLLADDVTRFVKKVEALKNNPQKTEL